MIWRLVAAQLWRIRWQLGLLCLLGANGWLQENELMSRLFMAMPMLTAFSTLTGLGLFWTRDVRILPIPRRAALRSAWAAALAFPAAIMAGRLLVVVVQMAFGSTITRGIESIALAAIWETAFVGASLTIMQADDVPWNGLRHALGQRGSTKTLMSLLWIVVPFAGPELIPRSTAEVNWLHLTGALVGIVIAAWPLVTAPDQWPRLGILDAPAKPVSEPPTVRSRHAFDWLPGMRRLWPGPVGTAAVIAVLTLIASAVITLKLEGVQSLFDAAIPEMAFFLIGGPFLLLMLGPFGWAHGVTPYLRGLRALPVSAMQIVLTLTMLPLMMPVFFWTLATVVHLVVGTSGATSWRLGSFALLCGVMALSAAVYARFNSILVMMAGWAVPIVSVFALMGFFDKATVEPVVAIWFPLVGVVGVSAAFVLNYRTVTRGSSSSPIYRPAPGESLYRGST